MSSKREKEKNIKREKKKEERKKKEKMQINENRNYLKTLNFNLNVRIPVDKELHEKFWVTFLLVCLFQLQYVFLNWFFFKLHIYQEEVYVVSKITQPSRSVLRKKCFKNIQQVYRKIPMPKCNFNKAALQ